MKSRSIGAAAACGVADPVGAATGGAPEGAADTDAVADALVDGFWGAATDDSSLVALANGSTAAVGAAAFGVGLLAEVADDAEGCFAVAGAAGADFGESKGGAVGVVAACGPIDRVGGYGRDGVDIGFAVDGAEADAAAAGDVDADLEVVFAGGVEP